MTIIRPRGNNVMPFYSRDLYFLGQHWLRLEHSRGLVWPWAVPSPNTFRFTSESPLVIPFSATSPGCPAPLKQREFQDSVSVFLSLITSRPPDPPIFLIYLSASFTRLNSFFLKSFFLGVPGWLRWLSVQLLILAQIIGL